MLDRYIGECLVLIININNGIKEPTCGHQYCNTSQFIDIWWTCQGERIFVYPSYNPFSTILILAQSYLGLKVLAWYIYMDTNSIKNNNIVEYSHLTGIKT